MLKHIVRKHKDLKQSNALKDEKVVQNLGDVLDDFVNPFQESTTLLNVSNALVAPPEVAADLPTAREHDEARYR